MKTSEASFVGLSLSTLSSSEEEKSMPSSSATASKSSGDADRTSGIAYKRCNMDSADEYGTPSTICSA